MMSLLKMMKTENTKKKKANNQEDEISKQNLQSQRTEEYPLKAKARNFSRYHDY